MTEIRWRRDALAIIEDRLHESAPAEPWHEVMLDDEEDVVVEALIDALTPPCPLARPWRYNEPGCGE